MLRLPVTLYICVLVLLCLFMSISYLHLYGCMYYHRYIYFPNGFLSNLMCCCCFWWWWLNWNPGVAFFFLLYFVSPYTICWSLKAFGFMQRKILSKKKTQLQNKPKCHVEILSNKYRIPLENEMLHRMSMNRNNQGGKSARKWTNRLRK